MGTLRFLLALAVVLAHVDAHAGPRMIDGLAAVELFFIISGFYMAMILERKYAGPGGYRLFLGNRLLRLFPVYWTVIVLIVAVAAVCWLATGSWGMLAPYAEHGGRLGPGALGFLATVNSVLFGQDLTMFLGVHPDAGALFWTADFRATSPELHRFLLVPQAWSLGVELLFYALVPLLVRLRTWPLLGLLLASLGLRAYIYAGLGLAHDPWTYRFFPTELALFLLGILAYRGYRLVEERRVAGPPATAAIAALFLLVVGYQLLPFRSGALHHLENWLIYGLAVLCVPLLFARSRSIAWDNRLGEFSYPIYICHGLAIWLMEPLLRLDPGRTWVWLPCVGATLALSWLLLWGVADRVETFRQRRALRQPSA